MLGRHRRVPGRDAAHVRRTGVNSRMTTRGWLPLSKWRGDSVHIPNTERHWTLRTIIKCVAKLKSQEGRGKRGWVGVEPLGAGQWRPTRLGGAGAVVPPKPTLGVCPPGGSEGRQRYAGSSPAQHGIPGALPALGCPSGAESGPWGSGHPVRAAMAVGPWALLQPPGASRSENRILSPALP